MPVIRTPAKSVDKPALTFEKSGGNSGAAFQSAVIGAIQDNPTAIPQAVASLQITEIAELAQQQDDTVFERLINNNVNCRYTSTLLYTKPSIPGSAGAVDASLVPFNSKNFSGGGMELSIDKQHLTSNKCGVYRVSFGLHITGVGIDDLAVYLVKTENSGVSSNYGSKLWQGFGVAADYLASGSDLIDLECGESLSLGLRNEGGIGGISWGAFDYVAWIAVNYKGNQY